jgi:hypothetical protein
MICECGWSSEGLDQIPPHCPGCEAPIAFLDEPDQIIEPAKPAKETKPKEQAKPDEETKTLEQPKQPPLAKKIAKVKNNPPKATKSSKPAKKQKKSGRQRKAKRRALKKVEAEIEQTQHDVWGLGGEQQAKQNNKLIRRSLRWQTNSTSADLNKLTPEEMKAKEIALLVTRRNMLNPDPKVSNNAIANLVRMEGQNQTDDKGSEPTQHLHLHANPEDNPYLNAPMEKILEAKSALANLEEAAE